MAGKASGKKRRHRNQRKTTQTRNCPARAGLQVKCVAGVS